MEDPAQDGVTAPAAPGAARSKLETLPKEDLIKFAKKQMMLLQKAKSKCTELEKEIDELKSKPIDGGSDDIIKVLTERLDAVLLEKAETEQQCLSLKKENAKIKQEVEDSVTKMEDEHKEFEQLHRNYVKEIEDLKSELITVHSKHNEDKAGLQRELEEAINKQAELSEQLKFQSSSESDIKELQDESQKMRSAFEEQIFYLQKQLEAITDEKKQAVTHLQEVMEANSQQYQRDTIRLQEEVKELTQQIKASAKEHEAEISKLNQLKEDLARQCEASEQTIREKYKCELENLRKATSDANPDLPVGPVLLQKDTFVEQIVNEKTKYLQDSLKELESQHSILKDEVTYMNNLKLKLEMDAQHIKDEFFHEREDLEFKINELLLAKEEQGCVIEKLKYELEDLNKQFHCAIEQHKKEVQNLKEKHQKEVSELNETFLSGSEKEKLALMFEIQGLKEQCENLQQEKQEAILNYESLREIMEILQTELGESAGKISQEFESMKQQQASDVHELQQRLRTAFNEKDALLETVNLLQEENEKLLHQRELVSQLENTVKSLQEKNEVYLLGLSQRNVMIQELEAKISSLVEEKDDFISKIKNSHEEIDGLHRKCEREESLARELREKQEQATQYSSALERQVNELTGRLDETLKEKVENDQKLENLKVQMQTISKDQEALSSEVKSLYEENSRLCSEKDQLSRDLEILVSQKEDFTLKEHITELEKKLQLIIEERDNLKKLFENEQAQKSFVKTQLCGFLKQMRSSVSEENEEEDVRLVLQAVGESLAKVNEENHNLVLQYVARVLELEKEVKCLQEKADQCEELRSLLRDFEQEKILLRQELEGALSEKETLQFDLLEIKNANEKRLDNHNLSIQVEEVSHILHSKTETEVHDEKPMPEHEDLRPLLEQKEVELQDVRAELLSLKDSLEKLSLKDDQLSSVKELEEKIANLEKESKGKEEKLSKIKLVAVKAKKELDFSRKEAQTLKEELESVRAEKDQLSVSMRDLIQGAESYKVKGDPVLSGIPTPMSWECADVEPAPREQLPCFLSLSPLVLVQYGGLQDCRMASNVQDAQQTTLMNMEIADYERLTKELNQQLTNKNSKIEDLEQEIKIQRQKQETLQEELTSLQSSLQQHEEKHSRVKQLLVKTKKELADAKQAEIDHLTLQASLKGELEASHQQGEVYKIQLAEATAEKHKLHEHLKVSAEQHQRVLGTFQQRVAALQEENCAAKAEQAAVASEFENYKVRVHNVLKQQKNKCVPQAEAEGVKQEREHLEKLVDQLKIKLQDSQSHLQASGAELQTLQSEHDTLLERHNRMLQETVTKEAELREKLCSVQSENLAMKAENAKMVTQLMSQSEVLRSSFREQVRHLQDEHRKTVETLQQQLSKVEAQLFQLKSEPTTRTPCQPLKNLRERRTTDLPLLDMHTVTREEGEGMETADTESVSSASTCAPSLEQLLSSPETKLEPPLWHAEFTKEELVQKLSSTTKSAEHLNGLLRETEATNAILMEQVKLLKSEIRRLERNQEREKSVASLEYLKNVLLQFIFLKPGSERERLLPVIDTMLQLSPEEKGRLAAVAQGEEENASRSSGWASYLHSWSGLR
nr:GRIP and coiled-coil domain-containing protein 2 [Cavia porcellus]